MKIRHGDDDRDPSSCACRHAVVRTKRAGTFWRPGRMAWRSGSAVRPSHLISGGHGARWTWGASPGGTGFWCASLLHSGYTDSKDTHQSMCSSYTLRATPAGATAASSIAASRISCEISSSTFSTSRSWASRPRIVLSNDRSNATMCAGGTSLAGRLAALACAFPSARSCPYSWRESCVRFKTADCTGESRRLGGSSWDRHT
mmetsp:Transcript_72628/g.206832  ORF Transcript_72628/g.206832 Transcript_72628/m.206832 type:complete len:202 (-) Transcript_72628:470-1075(-)